jgi:hypothetical protein
MMTVPRSSRQPVLRVLALLLAVLVVSGSVRAAAAPPSASGPAPAASYRLDAAVDLERSRVTVSERVQVRNVVGVALDTLVFRVVPNALGAFELTALTVDGQAVERRLEGSVLDVTLPRPLLPGQTAVVELGYGLAVPREPGRLTATPRSMTLGYWFPMLAVHRGEWDRRPYADVGDATFSEVADFDLTVTADPRAHVVATGQRVEQEGGRWLFRASSVRDLALALSLDFVVRKVTVGGTALEAAATTEERAAYFASRAGEFLRWSTEKLGPFPYPTLVVVDADLPASFGGLEYPGLIILSRAYALGSPPEGGGIDAIYLHEILHQWFYSSVGNDQIADPWLDEAFATYLAYAYYREVRPDLAPAVYERTIAGSGGGNVDSTVYDYPSDPPYFGVVYRRGARFLEALHARMGDGPFWALLREHVETYRDRIASPRSLLDRAIATSPAPVGPLVAEHFSYGAFRTATPRVWTVDAPAGPWSGTASVFVAAEFPVTRVQVFLDSRKVADGPSNNLTLDLADVEPGSYVLLVRVWDHDEVMFERARRVEITR